ncbi:MAG TPA: hypothetical protein VMT00_17285 [Thermoanaerobaculia bacterium]|nr:hypothetical protein [Thermoanaerobaculia bacterium]
MGISRDARRSATRELAVVVLFAILTLAMTWPLAIGMSSAVAFPADPYINVWILDWVWHAARTSPLQLFHANIFHPLSWTLAFSENLIGIALLLFPLRAIGVEPLLAHNVALILGFIFTSWGAYLLGRILTGSTGAGIVAGIFFAFLPWRFTHLSHLQHMWPAGCPCCSHRWWHIAAGIPGCELRALEARRSGTG